MRFPCLIIGILAVLLILVLLWTCRVAGPPFSGGNGVHHSLEIVAQSKIESQGIAVLSKTITPKTAAPIPPMFPGLLRINAPGWADAEGWAVAAVPPACSEVS